MDNQVIWCSPGQWRELYDAKHGDGALAAKEAKEHEKYLKEQEARPEIQKWIEDEWYVDAPDWCKVHIEDGKIEHIQLDGYYSVEELIALGDKLKESL